MDLPEKDESFIFGAVPTYVPETQAKVYYEAVVKENEVRIIMRGGPLEPAILVLKGEGIDVVDWWGWGQG